ncbi:DUF421 domain-containing protein [Yoonia sp. 208BN28-4]|uniref:DUF421 domain-containing protein n=1 Tax=Yoonia sp. 208BN28-4 TaxID=3126505 RepID=UPI0030A84AFD
MFYDLIEIFLRAIVCVITVVVLIRINGLRSFSKMSSFDFAITVACGSVIASSVISPKESVLLGVAALAALFAVQAFIAWLRAASEPARQRIDNAPLMLMRNGEIFHENLHKSRMTESDLYGKLREANAYNLDRVHAVIFEPTGDVSVLHGNDGGDVSPEVLDGVQVSGMP